MKRKALLAHRVREIRLKLFGEDGLSALARALDIPAGTWLNYELGVTMPAEVLLAFLEITGADPRGSSLMRTNAQ